MTKRRVSFSPPAIFYDDTPVPYLCQSRLHGSDQQVNVGQLIRRQPDLTTLLRYILVDIHTFGSNLRNIHASVTYIRGLQLRLGVLWSVLGTAGKDNIYGNGRLNLLTAPTPLQLPALQELLESRQLQQPLTATLCPTAGQIPPCTSTGEILTATQEPRITMSTS